MQSKKDYESCLRMVVTQLKGRENHQHTELDMIARSIPIRVLQSPTYLANYAVPNNLSVVDAVIIINWIEANKGFLSEVKVDNDSVSYDDVSKYYELARVNMIMMHRINYMVHECMLQVYEILEREKRLKFLVKKYKNEAERIWDRYYYGRRKVIEDSAWRTLSDHLRLADAAVIPYREKVYEAIRDYMIGHRMKDIELKGRCHIVFLMGKVMATSFGRFFKDFQRECGIDFSASYQNDNLYDMVVVFACMCSALGIDNTKDSDGHYVLRELKDVKNVRIAWAWEELMKMLNDDDLMDETAKNAIDLNPSVQDDYRRAIEAEERKQIEAKIGELSDKFKVSSL